MNNEDYFLVCCDTVQPVRNLATFCLRLRFRVYACTLDKVTGFPSEKSVNLNVRARHYIAEGRVFYFYFCREHPVVLLNWETTGQYFSSSQHNGILFYIFYLITTCWSHWAIFTWPIQNCTLPYSKFCKGGRVTATCSHQGKKYKIICRWTNKMHNFLQIIFIFPCFALHISDALSVHHREQHLVNCITHLVHSCRRV